VMEHNAATPVVCLALLRVWSLSEESDR
jgi:hypothetical protein